MPLLRSSWGTVSPACCTRAPHLHERSPLGRCEVDRMRSCAAWVFCRRRSCSALPARVSRSTRARRSAPFTARMYNASNETFLRTLRPSVLVLSSNNGPLTPDFGVVTRLLSSRVFPGPRDIFMTGVLPPMRAVLGERLKQFKSTEGHVVIRVENGGERFRVFVLEDGTENHLVTAVHGPYSAR